MAVPVFRDCLDTNCPIDHEDSVILELMAMPRDDDTGVELHNVDIAIRSLEDIAPEAASRVLMVPHAKRPLARRCHLVASSIAFL